jgi:hypothetical protein
MFNLNLEIMKKSSNTAATSNDVNVAEIAQTPAQTPATPEKKRTKKSVVIEFLDKDGGSSIKDMAQAIVDLGLDPDLPKNERVVRLWISKIGFKTTKLEGGKYARSI